MVKKIISLFMACTLAVSVLAGCSSSGTENSTVPADTIQAEITSTTAETSTETNVEASTEVGSYSVVTKGMSGDISMTVAIADGEIEVIKVEEHSETPGIGATVTSNAILEGVEQALTEAGLDVASFKEEKKAELAQGENEETDVVIVGAGLMAAYELKDDYQEVSFVVVEKLDMITGSLPVTGGAIIASNSELHKADSVECSVEDIIDLKGAVKRWDETHTIFCSSFL